MEIRWSYDRLISTMGFPILVRWQLYIKNQDPGFVTGGVQMTFVTGAQWAYVAFWDCSCCFIFVWVCCLPITSQRNHSTHLPLKKNMSQSIRVFNDFRIPCIICFDSELLNVILIKYLFSSSRLFLTFCCSLLCLLQWPFSDWQTSQDLRLSDICPL